MSLGKIIAIIIAIPTFILIVIPMILTFWTEGIVIDALMEAFGINPIIAGLIAFLGIIALVYGLIKLASSTF